MNRNENRKEHYYPGRYISFIAGKEAYDPPIERLKRQKRLKSLVSYDPIVVEYRWVDCLSDTEETPTCFRLYRNGEFNYWFIDRFYKGFRISEVDVNRIISNIEKNKTYALPAQINSSIFDGIYQNFKFFDCDGKEIVEISGNNPWDVCPEIESLTKMLMGFIKPNLYRLPRRKPVYDMFNVNRHNDAVREAKADVEDIINDIIARGDATNDSRNET